MPRPIHVVVLLLSLLLPQAGMAAITYDVTNTTDEGSGSLREAFASAATDGDDSIINNVVGGTFMVGFSTSSPLPEHNEAFSLTFSGQPLVLNGSLLLSGDGIHLRSGTLVLPDGSISYFPGNGIEFDGSVTDSIIGRTSGCGPASPSIVIQNAQRSGIIISGSDSQNNLISCAQIINNGDDGVTVLNGAQHNTVEKSDLSYNTTNGFKVSGSASYNTARLNKVIFNSQSGMLAGDGGHHNTMGPDNTIQNNFLSGLQIDGLGSDYNLVTGNTTINSNGLDGITISNDARYAWVYDNTSISQNGISGIRLTTNADDSVLVNNSISSSNFGIQILYSNRAQVGVGATGNHITNAYAAGIRIIGSQTDPASDNILQSNNVASNGPGILMRGTLNNNQIGTTGAGNTVSMGGFSYEACIEGNAVQGTTNYISDNTLSCWTGIKVHSNSSNISISKNTIHNGAYGIELIDSSGILVGDTNTITSVGTGIRISGTTGLLIQNNSISQAQIGIEQQSGTSQITGNTIYNIYRTGIWANLSSSGPSVISHNNIYETGREYTGKCMWPAWEHPQAYVCWPGILIFNESGGAAGNWVIGPDNWIHDNAVGVLSISSSPDIRNNNSSAEGISDNLVAGIRIEGSESATPTIRNNNIDNNPIGIDLYGGEAHIDDNAISNSGVGINLTFNPEKLTDWKYKMVYGSGSPSVEDLEYINRDNPFDLYLSNSQDSPATIVNNTFSSNVSGIVATETKPANLVDLANGTAGNNFSSENMQYLQQWYGAVGAVSVMGDQVDTYLSCKINYTGDMGGPGTDGYCPLESLLGETRDRSIYTGWFLIPQVVKTLFSTTIIFDQSNPHTVTVEAYGQQYTAQYSFDGDTSNDGGPAPTINLNHSGHLQTAMVVVPLPQRVFFSNNTTGEIIDRSELSKPLHLFAVDETANLNNLMVETVTAVVTDATSLEFEEFNLSENLSAPDSGVFTAEVPKTLDPVVPRDGQLSINPKSVLFATYYPPSTSPVQGKVEIWENTGTRVWFERNSQESKNVILNATGNLFVFDESANHRSDYAETLTSAVALENEDTEIIEIITLIETGLNTNIFTSTFELIWTQNVAQGDKELAAEPGDIITATYRDLEDPTDVASASVTALPAPFKAVVSLLDDDNVPITELLPDQMIYLTILDRNRNLSLGAETIKSADSKAATFADAVVEAKMAIYSLDEGGKILDWEPLRLKEKSGNTAEFLGRVLTNRSYGVNAQPNVGNKLLFAPVGSTVAVYYIDPTDADFPSDTTTLTRPVRSEPNNRFLAARDTQGNQIFRTLANPAAGKTSLLMDLRAPGLTLSGPLSGWIQTEGRIQPDKKPPGAEDLEKFTMGLAVSNPPTYAAVISQDADKLLSIQDSVLDVFPGVFYHARWKNPKDPADEHHFSAVFCEGTEAVISFFSDQGDKISAIVENTPFRIRLVDLDQNKNGEGREVVNLNISTDRDSEILAAIETGPSTGVFEVRVIPDSFGKPVSHDGLFTAHLAESIYASYSDDSQTANSKEMCRFSDQAQISSVVVNRERTSFLYFRNEDEKEVARLSWGNRYLVDLFDGDANLDPELLDSAVIRVAAGGNLPRADEWFDLTLQETEPDSGRFRSSIILLPPGTGMTPAAISLDDLGVRVHGLLPGDRVYAAYTDPDDVSDQVKKSISVAFLPLKIEWKLSAPTVALGDLLRNTLTIYNPNPVSVPASDLNIAMLDGLRLHPDGIATDPGIVLSPFAPRHRIISLPPFTPKQTHRMRWLDAVPPGIKTGTSEGTAQVQRNDELLSNRETVSVDIRKDPFFEQGTIVGRIFYDNNGDGWMAPWDHGVTSAVLYTSLGHKIVTDRFGRFHIPSLPAGTIAIKPELSSLPAGSKVSPEVQSVEIWPGELSKVNFAVQVSHTTWKANWKQFPFRHAKLYEREEGIVLLGSLREKLTIGGKDLNNRWVSLEKSSGADDAVFLQSLQQVGIAFTWHIPEFQKVLTATIDIIGASGILWSGPLLPAADSGSIIVPDAHKLLKNEAGGRAGFRMEVLYKDGIRAATPVSPLRVFDQMPTEELAIASHFEVGSRSLEPITILNLRDAAGLLRSFPDAKVIIEGHTDNTGTRELNQKLSQERAEKGKEYMRIVEQIDPARITAIGYGQRQPIFPNRNDREKSMNRRVVVKVIGVPKLGASEFAAIIRNGQREISVESEDTKIRTLVRPGSDLFMQSGAGKTLSMTLPEFGIRVMVENRTIVPEPDFSLPVSISAPYGSTIRGAISARHEVTGIANYNIPLLEKDDISFTIQAPDGSEYQFRSKVRLAYISDKSTKKAGMSAGQFLQVDGPPRGTVIPRSGIALTGRVNPQATLSSSTGSITRPTKSTFVWKTGPLSNLDNNIAIFAEGIDKRIATVDLNYPIARNDFIMVGTAELVGEMYRQNIADSEHPNGKGLSLISQGSALISGRFGSDLELTAWAGVPRTEIDGFVDVLTALDKDQTGTGLAVNERSSYMTYADESRLTSIIAPLGPFYLSIKKGPSEAGWGRFHTGGNRFSLLDDSSQGAGAWFSTSTVQENIVEPDWQTGFSGWIQPQSRAKTLDRFMAVGSSLYLLRNNRLVEGSEQVEIGTLEGRTGLIQNKRLLVRGDDYRIDYDLGQIIMLSSIPFLLNRDSLISDGTAGSDRPVLFVRYEYDKVIQDTDWQHYEEISQQISKWSSVAGYYRESRNEEDVTRKAGAGLYAGNAATAAIALEWGSVFSGDRIEHLSTDGGFSWQEWIIGPTSPGKPANAYHADSTARYKNLVWAMSGNYLESGFFGADQFFANRGLSLQNDIVYSVDDETSWWSSGWGLPGVRLGHRWLKPDQDAGSDFAEELVFSYEITGYSARLGFENRHGVKEQLAIAAAEFGYGQRRWQAFVRHQHTLTESSNPYGVESFVSTIGGQFSPTTNITLDASLQAGSDSFGGEAGIGWRHSLDGTMRLAGGYRKAYSGADNWFTGLTGSQKAGKRLTLTASQRFSAGDLESGWLTTAGLDASLLKGWHAYGGFSRGVLNSYAPELEVPGALSRTVANLGTILRIQPITARIDGEIRWDKGSSSAPLVTEKQRSLWSSIRYKLGNDLYTQLNNTYSDAISSNETTSYRQVEMGIGFGYRPIKFNALDLLGTLRWLSLIDRPDRAVDRDKTQALIAATDVYLQFPFRLFVRGKGALKLAIESLDDRPVHLSTMLLVGGAGWQFWKMLYVYSEYRYLHQFQTLVTAHGPTIEFGVIPQPWAYVGLGYNFSRVDDKLYNIDPFDREGIYAKLRVEF